MKQLLQDAGVVCRLEADTVELLSPSSELGALVIQVEGGRSERLANFKLARSRFADISLVGVWPDAERTEVRRALTAGLDGVVLDSRLDAALAPTVQAVCHGLVCLPRRTSPATDAALLSSREKQVLGMLIMGFTNAEIGQRLYLAESTVKSHVSSAYMKLGVRSRKDAAALILDPYDGLGTGILAITGA